MKDIYEAREEFERLLYNYRCEQALNMRELAEKAGISQSLISGYENSEKGVSAETALKLADALELEGNERDQFLILAAATRRRDRLVAYARELPAEVLNWLPRALRAANIDLDTISDCEYNAGVGSDQGSGPDQLVMDLSNGRKVVCSLSVVAS